MTSLDLNPLVKSWIKVFIAASISAYMAGGRDWKAIAGAGIAAVLPLIYTWLDPTDDRWGRVE